MTIQTPRLWTFRLHLCVRETEREFICIILSLVECNFTWIMHWLVIILKCTSFRHSTETDIVSEPSFPLSESFLEIWTEKSHWALHNLLRSERHILWCTPFSQMGWQSNSTMPNIQSTETDTLAWQQVQMTNVDFMVNEHRYSFDGFGNKF